MTILEQVCASSSSTDVIIDTLELTCPSWAAPQRLVQGFFDQVLGFGDGTYDTFKAVPIGLVLPSRSNETNQKLVFALDNVLGEAQRLIDLALESEERITLTFRRYLLSNIYGPAEPPFVATVLGGGMTGSTVQLNAGFHNLLDYKWPRDVYDLDFAPDLAYL